MAPLYDGVAREESVLDTWELGSNLTEGTTIVFGPVGSIAPTGMRHCAGSTTWDRSITAEWARTTDGRTAWARLGPPAL